MKYVCSLLPADLPALCPRLRPLPLRKSLQASSPSWRRRRTICKVERKTQNKNKSKIKTASESSHVCTIRLGQNEGAYMTKKLFI